MSEYSEFTEGEKTLRLLTLAALLAVLVICGASVQCHSVDRYNEGRANALEKCLKHEAPTR